MLRARRRERQQQGDQVEDVDGAVEVDVVRHALGNRKPATPAGFSLVRRSWSADSTRRIRAQEDGSRTHPRGCPGRTASRWARRRSGRSRPAEPRLGRPVRYHRSRAPKRDVEDHLIEYLPHLGLNLFDDGSRSGRQYTCEAGRIDLLCRDASSNFVVLELKKGEAPQETLLQILRYMSWVRQNLSHGKDVRGMIVAESTDAELTPIVGEVPCRGQAHHGWTGEAAATQDPHRDRACRRPGDRPARTANYVGHEPRTPGCGPTDRSADHATR